MAWPRRILFFSLSLAAGGLLGFFWANNLARPSPSALSPPAAVSSLTPEEITHAIAVADAQPDDVAMQRKLGLGLYEYARLTPNAPYLKDLVRLFERAQKHNPQDREVTFALGNTLLALGRQGETARLSAARKQYQTLLATQPDDADARTALGLAYYFDQPAQTASALAAWRRVLQTNPRHEGALQSLASALLDSGQRDEATPIINELARVNPQHPALAELQAKLRRP